MVAPWKVLAASALFLALPAGAYVTGAVVGPPAAPADQTAPVERARNAPAAASKAPGAPSPGASVAVPAVQDGADVAVRTGGAPTGSAGQAGKQPPSAEPTVRVARRPAGADQPSSGDSAQPSESPSPSEEPTPTESPVPTTESPEPAPTEPTPSATPSDDPTP